MYPAWNHIQNVLAGVAIQGGSQWTVHLSSHPETEMGKKILIKQLFTKLTALYVYTCLSFDMSGTQSNDLK